MRKIGSRVHFAYRNLRGIGTIAAIILDDGISQSDDTGAIVKSTAVTMKMIRDKAPPDGDLKIATYAYVVIPDDPSQSARVGFGNVVLPESALSTPGEA